jgi:hypothetical protein
MNSGIRIEETYGTSGYELLIMNSGIRIEETYGTSDYELLTVYILYSTRIERCFPT